MVGFFSKFSVSKRGHRRTQSALEDREVLPPNAEASTATIIDTTGAHGFEVPVEFKPVEHPTEPLDNDQPIMCPLPEPSILNDERALDGRIWKERVTAADARRRADLPPRKEGATGDEADIRPPQSKPPIRSILPSLSCPEHNLLNLLDECNASGS